MAREFLTPPHLKAPLQLNGAAGNAGQVLTSQGVNNPPIWVTPSTGSSAGANLYLNANFI